MIQHHCYPSLVTCVTFVSSRVFTHHHSRKHCWLNISVASLAQTLTTQWQSELCDRHATKFHWRRLLIATLDPSLMSSCIPITFVVTAMRLSCDETSWAAPADPNTWSITNAWAAPELLLLTGQCMAKKTILTRLNRTDSNTQKVAEAWTSMNSPTPH